MLSGSCHLLLERVDHSRATTFDLVLGQIGLLSRIFSNIPTLHLQPLRQPARGIGDITQSFTALRNQNIENRCFLKKNLPNWDTI